METNSAQYYNKAARECGENLDAASKQLFEALVKDEEGHFGEFDKQQRHIHSSALLIWSFSRSVKRKLGSKHQRLSVTEQPVP